MDWRKPISFSLSLPSNHHHRHIFSFLFLSSTKKRVLSAVLAALASLLLLFCLLFDASSPPSLLSRFLDSTSRTTSIGGEANVAETSPPAAMAVAKEAILVNASETSPTAAMVAEKEAIFVNATASSPPAAMVAAKEAILVNATASSRPTEKEAILVNATASSPPTAMAAKEAILVNATASSPPTAMAAAKEAILVNATASGPAEAVGTEEAKLGNSSGGFVGGEVNRTESPMAAAKEEFLGKECDLFDGKWVRDESMPYYPGGSCPYIDLVFDCHQNGRPDDGFLKWRWKPRGCAVPRLNATDFLERLRGKRIIYVGDSLNRNMWESLVCILRHSVKDKKKVYEASGRKDFKARGYYSFRFEDYKCSVDYVRSPFLVRELFLKNKSGEYDEKLRVDLMDETTSAYLKADIVVFNTGHWWTHEKTSSGIDYYQEGNYVYPKLNVMDAYKKALTTWARWVDKHINSKRTQVFFRGYSLTHFRGGQWNSGGQCHKETEPIFNETYLSKYPSKMKILEQVLHQMKTPVIYLNISTLTDYRKDGHPSIYRKKYNSLEEQIAEEKFQDCSHWCLPGVPDAWNELVYASLLMTGKGSWKR